MSFLKIKDPAKRDRIVKEYLETKKNIRRNQIAEKTGEIELQSDLSKFFKPITEAQKAATEKITESLKPIEDTIKTLPNYPGIQIFTSEGEITMGEGDDKQTLGTTAVNYLLKYLDKSSVDKTYGLYSKNRNLHIGDKEVMIDNNDILMADDNGIVTKYKGTPGFWELITSRNPDPNILTPADHANYTELVKKSHTLFRNNDPNSRHPKSARGIKWGSLSHIWDEIKPRGATGQGIIIPCDPNALVKKLDLLMASKAAGNTGVRNEIVSICDELKRQGHLDKKSYKKLMSIL